MMICRKCGAPLRDGDKFCSKCGARAPSPRAEARRQEAEKRKQEKEITFRTKPADMKGYRENFEEGENRSQALLLTVTVLVVMMLAVAAFVMIYYLQRRSNSSIRIISDSSQTQAAEDASVQESAAQEQGAGGQDAAGQDSRAEPAGMPESGSILEAQTESVVILTDAQTDPASGEQMEAPPETPEGSEAKAVPEEAGKPESETASERAESEAASEAPEPEAASEAPGKTESEAAPETAETEAVTETADQAQTEAQAHSGSGETEAAETEAETQAVTEEMTERQTESPVPGPSAADVIDPAQIQSILSSESTAAATEVYVYDLKHDSEAALNDCTQPMYASALITVPILYTAAHQIDAGAMTLDDPITYVTSIGGRGELTTELRDGIEFPLSFFLQTMVNYSDNNCINTLIDYIGLDTINSVCQEAGFTSVNMERGLVAVDPRGLDNYVSAKDLTMMVKDLYTGAFSSIGTDFMRTYFHISESDSLPTLAGLAPSLSGATVLNQNGHGMTRYNEIAVIEDGGSNYIMTIMLHGDSGMTYSPAVTDVAEYISSVMKSPASQEPADQEQGSQESAVPEEASQEEASQEPAVPEEASQEEASQEPAVQEEAPQEPAPEEPMPEEAAQEGSAQGANAPAATPAVTP